MANTDDKVMAAVEAALKKNPKASVDDLFQMAKGVSSGVAKLSKRQFHATYPLQVKRRAGAKKGRKPRRKKAAPVTRRKKAAPPVTRRKAGRETPARESVRDVLLRFASEVAGAEARQDVVKVVAGVDRYVDAVLKATGSLK